MSMLNSPIPCQDHNLKGEGTKGDIAIGNTSWSGGRWCMECRHFYIGDIQLLRQDRFSSALEVLLVAWKINWCWKALSSLEVVFDGAQKRFFYYVHFSTWCHMIGKKYDPKSHQRVAEKKTWNKTLKFVKATNVSKIILPCVLWLSR